MGLARPLQGTLIPTRGMLYEPDGEMIQRERAAEPHQPKRTTDWSDCQRAREERGVKSIMMDELSGCAEFISPVRKT